jgi:hypothetical protein
LNSDLAILTVPCNQASPVFRLAAVFAGALNSFREFQRKGVMRGLSGSGFALCLLFVQTAATPTSPATVRETLERFEFFGTWAPRCDQPASPDNSVRTVYVTTNGQVEFTESFGQGYEPNTYAVLDATIPNTDTVLLHIDLNGEIKQELTMSRNGAQLRTISNRRGSDGPFVVKNGIVAATGQPTPWLSHCADPR